MASLVRLGSLRYISFPFPKALNASAKLKLTSSRTSENIFQPCMAGLRY